MNGDETISELKNFVETGAYRTIKEAFEMALAVRSPVLVYGNPGVGKTVSLLKLAHHTGARLLTITQVSKTPRGMYEGVIEAFGKFNNGQYLRQIAEVACRAVAINRQEHFDYGFDPDISLEGKSRILMIDEYQILEAPALRELLEFCKVNKLPLLLCGNTEALANRTRESRQAMEQLRQRLLMRREIGKPSAADCRNLGMIFNVHFETGNTRAFDAIEAYGTQTSLRELAYLLQQAAILTGGTGSIRVPQLEAALMVFGGEKSLHLLSPSADRLASIGEETGSRKRIAKAA
jgi:DNA transposition AAA+ family ATPase